MKKKQSMCKTPGGNEVDHYKMTEEFTSYCPSFIEVHFLLWLPGCYKGKNGRNIILTSLRMKGMKSVSYWFREQCNSKKETNISSCLQYLLNLINWVETHLSPFLNMKLGLW